MMTIELSTSLRHMIDARLDNIERALMTKGTPRGDRRQILSAIEDQILEMLGQTAGDGTITRRCTEHLGQTRSPRGLPRAHG